MSKREYWNCDLCGENINENRPSMTLGWVGSGEAPVAYDLCIHCYQNLKRQIKVAEGKEEP